MALQQTSYRGCLLGLAVGDAMGYTVDNRSWSEIQEDYGPNGLLGYDLVNGYADVTSYTQLAAFTCNGLLFGLTRGQMTGKMAPFIKYIALSSCEWAASQRAWGRPTKNYTWLPRREEICRRHCMDTRMLETLSRKNLGTLETPNNNYNGPYGLTSAIAVGLFYDEDRMDQWEIPNAWGSINIDDEGTPARKNVLIEKGVLKSYMVDKFNGRRMGMESTGNARRQGYAYTTTSRMTNTYIAPGEDKNEDIIASMEYGLYAREMGGGSVNPVTGEFNFAVNEGYMV